MNPIAIEVQGVTRRFGDVHAVENADLAIHEGEVFGLIGHNGAGKSTLFRMMLGLLAPDAGDIRIQGEPVNGPRFRETRRQIAYLPENVVFYDNLSGLETLRFFATLKDVKAQECEPLLQKVGLGAAAARPVREYSKGMRQRLGLAQALLGKPRIIFFDEPTTGLDPLGIRDFYDVVAELRDSGVTTILCTHSLAEIQNRVDRLALMRLGRLEAVGAVSSLRDGLDLPLRVQLRLQPGSEGRLRQALETVGGCRIEQQGLETHLHCDRSRKMPLLAVLMAMRGDVADIEIHEPSLEDVFHGYAARHA